VVNKNIHRLLFLESSLYLNKKTGKKKSNRLPFFSARRFKELVELSAKRKDGRIIPVELSLTAVKLKGRVYVVGIFRDISRRKKDEEVLRIREKAMTSSLNALVLTDIKGRIEYINPSFLKIWGYTQENEVLGKSFFDFWKSEKKGRHIFKWILTKGAWTGEGIGQRRDGSFFDAHIWGNIVHDEKGQARSVLASVVDISRQKRAERHLKKSLHKLEETLEKTIYALAAALEMRDPYTAGHQKRVADLSRAIAREMGLPKEKIESIYMSGLIHDVGKIYIPAEILSKPARLTDSEFSLIKEHPQKGYEILKDIDFPWPISQIILQHHERLDGSGYPRGLRGKEILIESRILGVADVVEAIASHRPYRPSLGVEAAMNEIKANQGVLYDQEVVECCLRLFFQKGYTLVS
jgi:PAS domain S-box-containing protein/putative nucleotidyltransferase with HDIG domain